VGCLLLGSTSLTLPNWRILLTNAFGFDGTLQLTNPLDPAAPQTLYRLQLP
jgi:hypothetical protein